MRRTAPALLFLALLFILAPSVLAFVPADLNQDGKVDATDMAIFFKAWRDYRAGTPVNQLNGYEPRADLDSSGAIDRKDSEAFFDSFLVSPSNSLLGCRFLSPAAYAALPTFAKSAPTGVSSAQALPSYVDNSVLLPAIGNQGQLGSCVAWAAAYGAGTYGKNQSVRWGGGPGQVPLSPAYMYGRLLDIEGTPFGSGTFIPDALNLLVKEGCPAASEVPYSDSVRYSGGRRASGFINRLGGWCTLAESRWGGRDVVQNTKGALAFGGTDDASPVVIAFEVHSDFFSVPSSGYYHYDGVSPVVGGHAMCVCGYDDSRQAFRVANSWGTGWGDHGYCWMDYGTFQQLVWEAYVLLTHTYDDAWGTQFQSGANVTEVWASTGLHDGGGLSVEVSAYIGDPLPDIPCRLVSVSMSSPSGWTNNWSPASGSGYGWWGSWLWWYIPSVTSADWPEEDPGLRIDLTLEFLDGGQRTFYLHGPDLWWPGLSAAGAHATAGKASLPVLPLSALPTRRWRLR